MAETTPRAAARTVAPFPFFACDAAQRELFSVNANIPLDALLEHAQCFMLSAESAVLHAATEADHPSAWGAHHMMQIASALIEAVQRALVEENRHV